MQRIRPYQPSPLSLIFGVCVRRASRVEPSLQTRVLLMHLWHAQEVWAQWRSAASTISPSSFPLMSPTAPEGYHQHCKDCALARIACHNWTVCQWAGIFVSLCLLFPKPISRRAAACRLIEAAERQVHALDIEWRARAQRARRRPTVCPRLTPA